MKKKPRTPTNPSLVLAVLPIAAAGSASTAWLASVLARKETQWLSAAHDSVHRSGQAVLDRDLADLESQLQRSLGLTQLAGTFEIQPARNGLRATHSTAPHNPIEIEVGSNGAFSDALDIDSQVSFFVFTSDGALLAQVARTKTVESAAFPLAALVRGQSSEAAYFRSAKGRFEALAQRPSVLRLILEPGHHRVRVSEIPRSNLKIAAIRSFDDSRASVRKTVGQLLTVTAASALLAFALGLARARRRNLTLRWLDATLASFRFGRLETTASPLRWPSFDRELVRAVERGLGTQSPFSPFFSGKWINAGLRVATWSYFQETLCLWARGQKEGHDVLLGDSWFVARVRCARPSTVDGLVRIFGRAFALKSYLLYHNAEGELLVLARVRDFEEWYEETKRALRALIDMEGLRAGDLSFRGVLIGPGRHRTAQEIFAKLGLDAALVLPRNPLADATAAFLDIDDAEPVLKATWVQIVSMPAERARELYAVDVATATRPKTELKSEIKTRLPPPPQKRGAKPPSPFKLRPEAVTRNPTRAWPNAGPPRA